MIADQRITLEFHEDDGAVRVSRGNAVSDQAWLEIRSRLGSTGRKVAVELIVPLERFLAQRLLLSKIIKRASIGVRMDDEIKAIITQANEDQRRLRSALVELEPLDLDQLKERLDGGRFNRDLRPFQERDLGHLLALSHGANFSVPGAGKTTVAFAAYEAERLAGRVEQLLVIGPLSAFGAWQEEARDCFEESPNVHRFDGGVIPNDAEVVLVNYQRLASSYNTLAAWVANAPTMVILDEAHRMKKGWGGQWGAACLSLAYLAQRRDILTGTPAPQAPKDFVALLDYLWPSQARRVLPSDALVGQPPPDAGHRIAQAIAPLFVRTTKEELALPPVTHQAVVVPLCGLQRAIYMALRDQYSGQFRVARGARVDLLRMGRVVMYLLEAATNPKLLTAGSLEGEDPDVFRHPPLEIPDGSELADLMARYNELEIPSKFQELGRLVHENAEQGLKTLVWSNFVRNLKLLQRQLAAYDPALIHGGVPAYDPTAHTDREREIAKFRGDPACKVLLANPAAMSEGISLHHKCHDAIYLDRTFNAGQYLQSIDRIHRLGLEDGVETRTTFLLTDETIDLAVDARVRAKAELLGEMLDDEDLATVALPNEEDYGPPIDDNLDLDALFKHLRGEDDG